MTNDSSKIKFFYDILLLKLHTSVCIIRGKASTKYSSISRSPQPRIRVFKYYISHRFEGEKCLRMGRLFNSRSHFAIKSLIYLSSVSSSQKCYKQKTWIVFQEDCDDGGADLLWGVDDLLDSWNSESDVHGSDSGEVESLQSHLSAGLADALSTKGSNGGSWFHCSWKKLKFWINLNSENEI